MVVPPPVFFELHVCRDAVREVAPKRSGRQYQLAQFVIVVYETWLPRLVQPDDRRAEKRGTGRKLRACAVCAPSQGDDDSSRHFLRVALREDHIQRSNPVRFTENRVDCPGNDFGRVSWRHGLRRT